MPPRGAGARTLLQQQQQPEATTAGDASTTILTRATPPQAYQKYPQQKLQLGESPVPGFPGAMPLQQQYVRAAVGVGTGVLEGSCCCCVTWS